MYDYKKIGKLLAKGWTREEVAEEMGCSVATVGRATRSAGNVKSKKREAAGIDSRNGASLVISLRIPEKEGAIIKIRGSGDELLGTIVLYGDGVNYRRPNQKIGAGRRISWKTLETLMALGFVQNG